MCILENSDIMVIWGVFNEYMNIAELVVSFLMLAPPWIILACAETEPFWDVSEQIVLYHHFWVMIRPLAMTRWKKNGHEVTHFIRFINDIVSAPLCALFRSGIH